MGPVTAPALRLLTVPTRISSLPKATVVIRSAPKTLETVYVKAGPGASYGADAG